MTDTDPDSEENLFKEVRQYYDPIEKVFNFSKKRVTVMKECAEV